MNLYPPTNPRRRAPSHFPPPSPSRSSTASRARSRPAQHAWLAALLTLTLLIFRTSRLRTARTSILRDAPHDPLTLHIFTSPKPFVGPDAISQLRALESWLALTPTPRVTYLCQTPLCARIAAKYAISRQSVDASFLDVPLLPAVIRATNTSTAAVSVLLNADVLLFDDFSYALRKLRRDLPRKWLAIAARWDVDDVPLSVLGPGRRPLDRYRQAVVNHVRENGMLHTYGGVDVWAWDSASGPLVKDVPTFVFGRGKYDNWLTHQAIEENVRAVVDVSEACTVVHVRHDHHLVVRSPSEMDGEEGSFWNFDARSKFELFINSFLAVSHGTYAPQMGTIMHAPLKLTSCFENDGFCIFQRVRPSSCRCEHSPYVGAAQNDPFAVNDSRVIFCGMLSNNYGDVDLGAKRWPITGRVYSDTVESSNKTGDVEDMTFGLPLVLEDILRIIARTDREKIILVVADFTERALVMEVVCSIRAVSVFPWLVIAALDDDMYRFCITRGLPVYLSEFDDSDFTDHANFRQLARFQIMFEIMKLGRVVYNIEPGSVFRSSPWLYSNKLKDAHMGILGRLPKSSYTNKNDEYVPASVVFVRPSKQTFGLLKEVMVHLQHHNKNVGRTLISLACAVDDENVKKMQSCRNEYGVRVHMFDSQLFRPMEKAMCPYCSDNVRPIVSYSGLFDSRGKVEDAVKVLRERGLSMTENGLRYCI